MDIYKLGLVAILITTTAFFVTSEFAIVKVRSTRIDQLVAEAKRGAMAAKKVTSRLDEYLSACQLGITVTSLGLGWLGGPAVAHFLQPLFMQMGLAKSMEIFLSVALSFWMIAFLHVVIGELVPKTVAIEKTEWIVLHFSLPLSFFYYVMYPFIWTLNQSSKMITKVFGLQITSKHDVAHTEEELRMILSESYKSGEINHSEFNYVNNIFEFDNRTAKEIMVPRTEMATINADDTLANTLHYVAAEKYTRYPVISGDKDHIIGLINTKEIFADIVKNGPMEKSINDYIRPTIQVIESIHIQHLLKKMQKECIYMAILMDEYGGTAGLVTVEDILEEIVGEIQDEFDGDEIPLIRKIKDDHYLLNAKVLISEVNDLLAINIDNESIDTIGGFILNKRFDIKQGQMIVSHHYTFKVIDMEGRHIKYVEVIKKSSEPKVKKVVDTKPIML